MEPPGTGRLVIGDGWRIERDHRTKTRRASIQAPLHGLMSHADRRARHRATRWHEVDRTGDRRRFRDDWRLPYSLFQSSNWDERSAIQVTDRPNSDQKTFAYNGKFPRIC